MKLHAIKGELTFAAFFAAVGLVWIVKASSLPFWSGFAPDSGFLPVIYGTLLLLLSAGVIGTLLLNPPDGEVEREPLSKSFKLLGILVLTVGSLGYVGFAAPLFLMMFAMFAYVERLPIVRSAIVSAVATGIFLLVFQHWLKIPVPITPWSY
jgi:hypothetical protein